MKVLKKKHHRRAYVITVSTIFSIIAFLHLIRIAYGWDVVISGMVIPLWVSWLIVVLCVWIAVWSAKRKV